MNQDHALQPITFHNDIIFLVEHEGQPFVPAKPIADNLGIGWQPQHRKLMDRPERWGIITMMIPSAGGPQQMTCLPMRKLPAWLYSIDSRKVRPEQQIKVEMYQAECDDALWDYWTKGHAVNPRVAAAPALPDDAMIITKDEMIALLKDKVELLELKTKPKRQNRPITDQDKAEIVRFAATGMSMTAIAKRVHRSSATVHATLREAKS